MKQRTIFSPVRNVVVSALTTAILTVLTISSRGAGVSVVNLHSFDTFIYGEVPYSSLVQGANGNFYGTTFEGGPANAGVIFEVASNGAVSTLYSFTNGVDGAFPDAGMVLTKDGNFYGTTAEGGTNGTGSIFRITPGGIFTPLYSFSAVPKSGENVDGANPGDSLVQATDGNLYGTASTGGANGSGTLFKISLGGAFQLVYTFSAVNTDGENSEGANPEAALIQGADGNFYGTAFSGGADGLGTVFEYIVAESQISLVHSFTGASDGANPLAALVQGTGGTFYGTASDGGSATYGTLFKISTGAFVPLYSFTNGTDGATPFASLVQGADGNLYGASTGGQEGYGTVFEMTTNGAVTPLYSFTGGNDGAYPEASLVQAGDGVFYGTTSSGGTNNAGSVFSITSAGTFTPVMSFMGGYDGNDPTTPLVQVPSGIFYGTTYQGGKAGDGVIFEVTTNGVLTPIYSFTNGLDGAFPAAGLTYGIDGNLYGTSFTGGAYNSGVLFKMTPGVGTLTVLNSFTNFSSAVRPMGRLVQGTNGNFYGTTSGGGFPGYPYFGTGTVFEMAPEGELTELYPFTNGVDGGNPEAGLVQGADGNFYGTTTSGGIPRTDRPVNTFGTIYKITPRGAFTPLYTFTNGADGAYPHCQLIQWSDGNFYGTAPSGGSNGYGTIFEITPSGSFTPLYSFTNGIDGATPDAGLVPGPGGNLYGTASSGGTYGMGTIFEFTTNRNLTPLYSFMGTNDGELPVAPLALGSDGNFYGTASLGGEADAGTVFKVELSTLAAPQFNSIVVGSGSITVSWTTVVGQMYQLQVASNLALFNWSNVSTPQTGTGGSLTYADGDIGNNQRYYRVSTYSP